MPPKDHPLFQHYPLNGQATLTTGPVPTPYHIYNGYGLFIGGTADLAVARNLLKTEGVVPAHTQDGKALMGIWVCDFTEASLGSHQELQFSIFVTAAPGEPQPAHPLIVLKIMLTPSPVQMLCHGLWNNTPTVVAYNRELLGLNAALMTSSIQRTETALTFAFKDVATDTPVVTGQIKNPHRPSLSTNVALMGLVGLRQLMAVAQQPWLNLKVINPISPRLNRNAAAETYTKNDTNVIRPFHPERDTLTFGATPYRALNFQPQFVQYMNGFKFVYLHPQ